MSGVWNRSALAKVRPGDLPASFYEEEYNIIWDQIKSTFAISLGDWFDAFNFLNNLDDFSQDFSRFSPICSENVLNPACYKMSETSAAMVSKCSNSTIVEQSPASHQDIR